MGTGSRCSPGLRRSPMCNKMFSSVQFCCIAILSYLCVCVCANCEPLQQHTGSLLQVYSATFCSVINSKPSRCQLLPVVFCCFIVVQTCAVKLPYKFYARLGVFTFTEMQQNKLFYFLQMCEYP